MIPKLPEFLVSYGSYHNNKINQLIHIICVPQIIFSLGCLLKHWSTTTFNIMGVEIDYYGIFLAGCFLLYMKIDLFTGFLTSLIFGALYFYSNHLWHEALKTGETEQHFRIFLVQHLVCWIAQFIGHGVFEKRNPALMDNLLLTLVAPDFVVIEVLFMLGFKKDLYDTCNVKVVENIKQFREGKLQAAAAKAK
jgi:uncharacterized membrane protein YGL010W